MNIFLSEFAPGVKNRIKRIPTPRMRSLLSDPSMTVVDRNVVHVEMSKGLIPIYRIHTSKLYSPEIQFLRLNHVDSVYFCSAATKNPILVESQCLTSNDGIDRLFGLDPEESEEICLRYVGDVSSKRVNHFCATWDKCFHLLQSVVRVMVSNDYNLTEKEKESFSLSWVKCLSTARIRFDLECDIDVVDLNVSVPLWLQQFSQGVVIIDTPNKMVSSSLASGMSPFLDSTYSNLKNLSLSLCKSFLLKAKDSPEYIGHRSKIDEWIKVCNKMSAKAQRRKGFSVKVVFGIIGSIMLIKALAKRKQSEDDNETKTA